VPTTKTGKGSPYSITERRVPQLIPVAAKLAKTIVRGTQISRKHGVGYTGRRFLAKSQLDSFSGFDRTPTCDGQTDRH